MDQLSPPDGQYINGTRIKGIRPNVVLREYPVDPQQFSADLAPFVDQIIGKHGLEEWKAAILTHEIHRHLGVYSIIGVKMGIRAREILGSDLDELIVESFAGYEPPISCMSDGLQVSTGASLGRGTIALKNLLVNAPAALFKKGGQQVTLVLKKSFHDQIHRLIASVLDKSVYGSQDYFDQIRNISINYWLELDRNDIFEVRKDADHENI